MSVDPAGGELERGLRNLPLMNLLQLTQHAQDVDFVDFSITCMERRFQVDWIGEGRPDLMQMINLRAFSRCWIFGVYELLRSWDQACSNLLAYYKASARIVASGAPEDRDLLEEFLETARPKGGPGLFEDVVFESYLRRAAAGDDELKQSLQHAKGRLRPFLNDLEVVRVKLAKHEFPGQKKTRVFDAGYARAEMETGSMMFFSETKEGETMVATRRGLADELRSLLDHECGS